MIEAVDVHKTFQSGDEVVEALRGVTFRVPAGSCTFIVGPSGSGKSTLLYLLGALDLPDVGDDPRGRPGHHGDVRGRARRLPAQPGRVRLPVVQPDRQPVGGRQRARCRTSRSASRPSCGRRRPSCSRTSAWAIG